MTKNPTLFSLSELPEIETPRTKDFLSLKYPVWSEGKARLIQEYIKLFTYVTKHGAYIDGFAAPQRRDLSEICSARLVLETEPKRVRDFWLCDKDPKGVDLLQEISDANRSKGRKIHIIHGDFNVTVDEVLNSGRIKSTTAAFALLDQRTFECAWETVRKIAEYKRSLDPSARKIEIFYFFATGWLDRSIAAVRRPQTALRLDSWWGNTNWKALQGMGGVQRARLLTNRFKNELGYTYAYPYAIHNKRRGGRTMYHMVHATDHPEASPLMLRAYRKISGRPETELESSQLDLAEWWKEME